MPKTQQDKWILALKSSFRKTLSLNKCFDKLIFDKIYDSDGTLKTATNAFQKTSLKWKCYSNNNWDIYEEGLKSVAKSKDEFIIQSPEKINWTIIKLANLGYFSKATCQIHNVK
jgi:hypothetical protein